MTTVTLSPRIREQIKRFTELFYDKSISLGLQKDFDDDDFDDGTVFVKTFGKFKVDYTANIPLHDESCDLEGKVTGDDDCCCDKYAYGFYLNLLYHTYKDVNLISYQFNQMDPLEQALKWVSDIPSSFELCSCMDCRVVKDGWCNNCYMYRYLRTEEEGGACCVCMENEGRWVKLLPCNHTIHVHCYGRLRNPYPHTTKCPLCRQDVTDTNYDPYDV
jgi:hypothetical protein